MEWWWRELRTTQSYDLDIREEREERGERSLFVMTLWLVFIPGEEVGVIEINNKSREREREGERERGKMTIII